MSTFKVNSGEIAGFVGYLRSSGDYKNKKMREKEAKAAKTDIKPPTPITMAQLAAVHEFGTQDGTIPERSFIRSSLADHSKEIKRLIKKVTAAIVLGKMDRARALGIVCQKIADGIVAKIDSGVPPPLSDETIRRKGSDHPLIDTGQLKNSVDWKIMGGK